MCLFKPLEESNLGKVGVGSVEGRETHQCARKELALLALEKNLLGEPPRTPETSDLVTMDVEHAEGNEPGSD